MPEGTSFERRNMIQCPNCGRENADNFNFCLDCGYDLKGYREQLAHAPAPVEAQALEPAGVDPYGEPGGATPTESLSATDLQSMQQDPVYDEPAPSAPTPQVASTESGVFASSAPAPLAAATPASAAPGAATQTGQAAVPDAGSVACPACKAMVPAGMKFCGSCGKRLDGGAAPAAASAPSGGRTMFMHAADLQLPVEKVCKLVTIDQSGKEGMTFSLKKGETVCGRVNGIILFFDDPYVSPTHGLFAFHDGKLTVTDKASLNGVYRRLRGEHVLSDGDFLRIGRQLFRFETMTQAQQQVQRGEGDDAQIWGSPAPACFGRLVQILEDGRTGEIRLLAGESCNLGREQGEIVFPTDGFISGRHCSFFKRGEQALLKDLGSSNGTYVRIRDKADIEHGEFLLIGNQMLRVEIS